MSPEWIIGEERTYPDHRQNDTDGTKNRLGRRRARDLLREIHCLDGGIQQGEGVVLTFRSLGLWIHS